MLKRFMVVLLLGALLLVSASGALAATTLTFWGHSNPAWESANKQLIAEFEAQNPDIKVVYETFPYEGFIPKLQTSFISRNVADVVEIWGMWAPEYIMNGFLAEIPADLYTPDEIVEVFFEPTILALGHDGKFYGLPREYNLEYGGIYVNTDLFAEAGLSYPTTWDELIETAKKLTKFDASGQMTQSGFHFIGSDSFQYLFFALMLQQGRDIWTEDGVHVDFVNPEAKRALELLASMVLEHKVVVPEIGEAHESFLQGRAAMYHRGPWVASVLQQEYPQINFDYIPTPNFTDSPPYFHAETGWSLVVAESSRNKEAAWKFVKFMIDRKSSETWNTVTGTIPAMKEIAEDPAFRAKWAILEPSFNVLPYGKFVGDVVNREIVWEISMDEFQAVIYGRKSVDKALEDMTKRINYEIDIY